MIPLVIFPEGDAQCQVCLEVKDVLVQWPDGTWRCNDCAHRKHEESAK